jgi:hypothetical protein
MGGAANIQVEGVVTPASCSGGSGRILFAGWRVCSLPRKARSIAGKAKTPAGRAQAAEADQLERAWLCRSVMR